jgi:uncharacterized membrane protein YkoI
MLRKLLFLTVLPLGVVVAQRQGVAIKAEKPEYSSQAKITSRVAVDSALARVPGGQVHEGELEKEHGRLVYSFDVLVPHRKGVDEVQVDARSGRVVSVRHESPEAEAKEHAGEHPKSQSQ